MAGILRKLCAVVLAAVLSGLVQLLTAQPAAAATGGALYVSPASGSFAVGTLVTMSLRESSNEPVNAVQFDLSYPGSILEFVSVDDSQSAFNIAAPKSGGAGKVSVARGNIGDVTGDNLVAFVNFKVIATGAAPVQVLDSSQLVSSQTGADIAGARNGANLTAVAAGTGTSGGSAGGSGGGGAAPAPAPSPSPAASNSGGGVSIKSQSKTSGASAPANGVVELSGSTTIEAAPSEGKTVSKVDYLLGSRLLATVTQPPYKYTLDASHLRNGTYTLTANTHYTDGTVASSDTKVVVKNPWNAAQIWLQLRHYAWLVVIIILILADIVWVAVRRAKRRRDGYAGKQDAYTVYGGDDGGTFTRQSDPSAVTEPKANPSLTAASLAASLDTPQTAAAKDGGTDPGLPATAANPVQAAPLAPTPAEPLSPAVSPQPTVAAAPPPQVSAPLSDTSNGQPNAAFNGPAAVVSPSADDSSPVAPRTGNPGNPTS